MEGQKQKKKVFLCLVKINEQYKKKHMSITVSHAAVPLSLFLILLPKNAFVLLRVAI